MYTARLPHTFTTDGEASTVNAVILLNPGGGKLRCAAHSINLAVNDALDHVKVELDVLRRITSYTRRSIVEADAFKKIQQQIAEEPPPAQRVRRGFTWPQRLSLAVLRRSNEGDKPLKLIVVGETRWNSTYYAIERAHRLRPALERFLLRDQALLTEFFPAMGSFYIAQFRLLTTLEMLEFVGAVLHPLAQLSVKVQSASKTTLAEFTYTLKSVFQAFQELIEESEGVLQFPQQALDVRRS